MIAVVLSGFFILFTMDELGLTSYVGFKQSLGIPSQTFSSQLQKIDFLFKSEWWSNVTNNNRIVQLIVLTAILIAGVITLAITDRQISQMTRPRT
jgi:hypothetical protein